MMKQPGKHNSFSTTAKTFLTAALMFVTWAGVHAQTEKYIQTLAGTIKKGDSCVVTDDKFYDKGKWAGIEKHLAVNNLVSFELRYDTAAWYFNRPFSCTLQVNIEYEKADRSKASLRNILLQIDFDTTAGSTHRGIVFYKFKGGHHVKITVNSISSPQWGNHLPPVFRLKNEIFIERLYTVNTKDVLNPVVVINKMPISKELPFAPENSAAGRTGEPGQQETVIWDAGMPGFPQFDFEWTFYDDSSTTVANIENGSFGFTDEELEAVFKNNSSRVTVSLPYYQLNLTYNRGWVFHRVRGVRYDEAAGVRTEGNWSYKGSYGYKGNTYGLIRCNGHEAYLNWQSNISFAEEGKRKEIVSYFDGSLRNRQSVTLNNDNTGGKAIVQESVFDVLGRPAVNILPAPVNENTLHYFPSFNLSAASNAPYQYADIEAAADCFKEPIAMSTVSGASQYYSAANPATADNSGQFYFTKYIPDAKGYPFAVTHFTQDNTGRIRTQGGVGPTFQPAVSSSSQDHTTRYFYGKPQQDELDRLFGNEAGNASHYLKNMVIDADGQASISYINASGKTIATALSGKAPDNLQKIPSYQLKNTPFITNLTDADNIVRNAEELSLTYSGTFLAAATGNFTLQYEFTPLSLQVLYGVENNKICADCYYDLSIAIADNCGNIVQSVKQEAIFTEKSACDPAPTRQEGKLPVAIQQPGEYNITYKLTLSRKAVDYYVDRYLLQDISLKQEADFQRAYMYKMDLSNCFNNCETCLAELGAESDFIGKMTGILREQHAIPPNEADTAWLRTVYARLLKECNFLQQGCGRTPLPCEEQTRQLKDDVTPGGQYMLYDAATNVFVERDINVFLKNLQSLTTNITINGVTRPFNQFSEQEIITYWNDVWADLLLPYHPENVNNCFIADCGKNAATDLYKDRFLNTVDAASAAAYRFWFADDYAAVVDNDPYFAAGAEGASKRSSFLAVLDNYKGTGQNIMGFVRWSVYCRQKMVNGDYPEQVVPCPRTPACNRAEDEWTLFKVLYYAAREELKDKNTQCNSNNLFADPTDAFLPVIDHSAAAPVLCADASFFEISNHTGKVQIVYKGSEKTTTDITVQYLAVNAGNQLVAAAGGQMVFPAGTVANTAQTVNSADNLNYFIDFARCDPAHPYYSKTRRNYNGISMSIINGLLQNTPGNNLNAAAASSMTAACDESCIQYADAWMQKLQGCNLNVDAVEYRQIKDGLVAVCKGSCRFNVQDHPFGASSTNPVTPEGDMNFKDVLLRVLGAGRFSSVCNDLLLDYPPAMDEKPLYTNEVVRTLGSCAYDKLKSWQAAYHAATGYSSFSQYIKINIDPDFSLTDVAVSSLLAAFESNCVIPQPVLLPASLNCTNAAPQTCLSCTSLHDEILNFSTSYAFIDAGNQEYFELLAKYINRKYAFSLSSVDIYNAVEKCNVQNATADTISCESFAAACSHFEALKPGYFTMPVGNPPADSVYKAHLTLWLNTELHRQLNFDYYKTLAARCHIVFHPPGNEPVPVCDTSKKSISTCIPQFITCCDTFRELRKFTQVFPDTADARLLALYFALLRTQWCTAVNLPAVDYRLPYDSLLSYFNSFRLANDFNITIRPDSLISYSIANTGTCTALAISFKADIEPGAEAYLYAICNKPVQPLLPADNNDCINQQLSLAMGNAHSDYLEYMEKIRRDYRDAYYTKCLSITPRLIIETVYDRPLEYHYTLYYYDQSGNLVKTISPAGVQPIDEEADGSEKMLRVKNFRLADKDYCYEYGDAPVMNGNASIVLADNPAIQQGSLPFTIEAFVKFNSLSVTQTIFTKQSINSGDNKTDGYKIYLVNGRLMVDLAAHGRELWTQTLSKITNYQWPSPYNNQPPVPVRSKAIIDVPRTLYRLVTAEITSDVSDLIAIGQWAHIAVQNTGSWSDPVRIYVNGSLVNSKLIANEYHYTPSASPPLSAADITAGTIEYDFAYSATIDALSVNNSNAADIMIGGVSDGLAGSIKQVRLYNRALTATEIRSNAFNTCLMPGNEGQLVAWLPLNKETAVGQSIDRVSQLITANSNTVFSSNYQPVYPAHKLPTHYYYNSLQAVTKQVSPDAGITQFFYDLPGRLAVSQNAEQKQSTRGEPNNRYSYTKYDSLGRVTETGEKTDAATITTAIAKTDPMVPESAINSWLASGNNIQVTQTIYDQPDKNIVTNSDITASQRIYNTSLKRVVASIYRNTITTNADYNSATHYEYDINGNVKRLWQEYKKSVTGEAVNMLKDLRYDYDLVSGKVNHIIYQQNKGDQFIYKYEYDPDNRLLRAYSGRDMNTLQQDAGYRYYLHGPLARTELGDALTSRIVQGSDYSYTLQGWLKGVNAVRLNTAEGVGAEMGGDGSPLRSPGIHAQVGRDVLAYTLGYYKDDYTAIGGAAATAFGIQYQPPAAAAADATGKNLFNGNISHMTYSIAGIGNGLPSGYSYGYDQLSRLRQMSAHDIASVTPETRWNNGSATEEHKELFDYDANGNIISLDRNGSTAGGRKLAMDSLNYRYYYYTLSNTRKTYAPGQPLPADAWSLTNQLARVTDVVPGDNYPNPAFPEEKDIDNQPADNYTYDGIGNLVRDAAEGINAIGWTVYGKIRSIAKSGGTNILCDYDAAGNRIQKQVIAGNRKIITFYIRDAQGNTIAVYSWRGRVNEIPQSLAEGDGLQGQVWEEQHLYGSNRLGMWKPGITVPPALDPVRDAVQVGSKFFELTNHLGNVVAVISDKKNAISSSGNPLVTDHYEAELISAQDYTPFGMQMAGRSFTISNAPYRYGFNGKENDNELKGEGNQQDYGMRVYDGRIGRFLSVDPISKDYPMLTPYQFGSNSPVSGVDQDGLEWSPAGKVGIFAIDGTAVQLYPDNPKVIEQQKADAPMVKLGYMVARANHQPSYLSTQWKPKNEFERQRHEALKEDWYDRDGYNADGSPKPSTRLAQDKTWNAFANKIALPEITALSAVDGLGEGYALWKALYKFNTREKIVAFVDGLLSRSNVVKELDGKAIIGYRGSLATGVKYKAGVPFNTNDFDIDAFIVSDKLARRFKSSRFRNGANISRLKELSDELEEAFKKIPGYRTGENKTFTFRIFTTKEFKSVVKRNGYKTL